MTQTRLHEASPRQLRVMAGVFFGGLLALTAIATLTAGGTGQDEISTTSCPGTQGCGTDAPSIIPRPNEGHAPTDSGEPGGIGQLLVLTGLVSSIVLIIAAVWYSGRQSRTGSDRVRNDSESPAS